MKDVAVERLENRVEELEHSVRRFRIGSLVALGLSAGILLAGAGPNGCSSREGAIEIRADRITLLHNGEPAMTLSIGDEMRSGDSLVFANADGKRLAVLTDRAPLGVRLSLLSSGEAGSSELDLFAVGTQAGLFVIDGEGENVGKFWINGENPELALFKDGRRLFSAP